MCIRDRARTIPLKGLNLSLEKYRMPDGVIIAVSYTHLSNAGIRAARATEKTAKQAQPALAQTG